MQTRLQQHTFTFRHFSLRIAKGKHLHTHTRKATRNSIQSINVKKIFKLWLRGHNRVWLMLLAIIIGIYLIRWNRFAFLWFFLFSTALPCVCVVLSHLFIENVNVYGRAKNIFTSSLRERVTTHFVAHFDCVSEIVIFWDDISLPRDLLICQYIHNLKQIYTKNAFVFSLFLVTHLCFYLIIQANVKWRAIVMKST